MKAPLSKKLLSILSDETSASELVHSVIVKDRSSENVIKFGNKKYELKRVTSFTKH